jgi:murein DD-endopeptidase MepM/ murein hydrolase activator NlpD
MKLTRVLFAVLCLILLHVAHSQADPIAFDSFEGSSIDPFWTLTQHNGNAQLSSAQSHSGSQSVQLTAKGGGQVDVWLTHVFSESLQGTLSVWFFDTGTGTYAGLYASDSTNPAYGFASNVADWSPGYGSPYIWHGPGVGESRTSVMRTPGWHQLELDITPTGFSALVDGVITGSVSGSFTFDTVQLLVSGPSITGTSYFDDFQVREVATVPEPGSLLLIGSGLLAMAWRRCRKAIVVAGLLLIARSTTAAPVTIDFDTLSDSDIISTQYPGVTFSHTIALTAGISLNEFEFPPLSGATVASDLDGPIRVDFAQPVSDVSGHFTYAAPLTARAFNASNVLLGSVSSLFSMNEGLSGDIGSTPNELLELAFDNIAYVIFSGDPLGGSFTLDNLSYTPGTVATVPEPGTITFLLLGLLGLTRSRRLPNRRVALCLAALLLAPSITSADVLLDAPNISQSTIPAGQATPVIVTARITTQAGDPALIPGSVTLIRQDEAGQALGVIGTMQDDGSGTNTFKLSLVVNEPSSGTMRLAVSAAFRGLLRRVISLPLVIPIYSVMNVITGSVDASGGTLQIPALATLIVPPGTFASASTIELTQVSSPMLDSMAADLGEQMQPAVDVPRLQIKVSQAPTLPIDLRINAPNLGASIPAGSDTRVFAFTKEVGDFGEQMDTLVGIGGSLCGGGHQVCVSIRPEDFYEDNPFLTQLVVTVYTPRTGGTIQMLKVTNVEPASGDLQLSPTDVVGVRATISLVSPFATGTPLVGPIGPLSHYGTRCADPDNNNKPVSLGPPCAPGLIVRPHNGIDIQVPSGTPVIAPMDGRTDFTRAGISNPAEFVGFRIWLLHDGPADSSGFSMTTAYFHLQCGALPPALVMQHQQFALTDSTGPKGCATPSYGPHLHLETTLNGQRIDPEPLFHGDVSGFLPYELSLGLDAGQGSTVLMTTPVTTLSVDYQADIPAATILSACGTNACLLSLSATSAKLGTQLLRRWTIAPAEAAPTVRLPLFGLHDLSEGPFQVQVVRLVSGVLTGDPAPADITVTLRRRVISSCGGVLFSGTRTVTILTGQMLGGSLDAAGRDPACNTLPIITEWTILGASESTGVTLDLGIVPPEQLVLSIRR